MSGAGGQVAFVTGSSRGIGLGAALELARAGFSVALNARKEGAELDAAAAAVEAEGARVCKVALDVAEIDRHEAALDHIENALGGLTTLVNNAGVSVLSRGDVLEVSEAGWDRCLDVNAKGLFFLSQACAKRFLARKREAELLYSIINVTSANATAASVLRGEYCASKAAAAMVSKVFAARLGCEEIAVFDVQPGLIDTEMTKSVIADYQRRAEAGLCLFPRVGQAAEVGKVVASLAGGGMPYVTGQVVSVDGGLLVERF